MDSVTFVAFLAEVIYCSAQTQSRTERIKMIMKAAQRYIGMGEVTLDEIDDVLTAVVQDTQSSCGGLCSNGQEFKKYIEELSEKPNVICVQETWLRPHLDFIIQDYVAV